MSDNADNLTIIFSDIAGSSQLYASLGNERAKQKIDQAIRLMCEVFTHCQGEIIKTIGDEIMAAHPEPERACDAIIKLHSDLKQHHFYLRTGVSYGRIIRDGSDLYGDTVNNAAFLAKTAQPNQVLLDTDTYSNLILYRQQCEYFDRIALKGQLEQSLIYRLNWEKGHSISLDATLVTNRAKDNLIQKQLTISYEGNSYCVDPNKSVCVGRDVGAVQICVRHINVSRRHCTISYHRGKFTLEDHSTNGTYLAQQGLKEVFLKRESTALVSDGTISIGQPNGEGRATLRYSLD